MEPIKQKGFHKLPEPVKGAVITVSDRCYAGTREDASGPLAAKLLADYDVIVDEVKLLTASRKSPRLYVRRLQLGRE